MHTFFLTLALYLLVSRRYWQLLPVVGVMALTRPSGLAFALALALHVAAADVGTVIGRNGRIARALRTLVRASSARDGRRVLVEIADPDLQ
jgi:predicted RNA-binding protein YlqC (UPF0109 family)